MHVGKLYARDKKPIISFEYFPPRNEKAAQTFGKVVDNLATLAPDYMSVTFGAGGSTREGSYQTVKQLVEDKKIPTVAYLAGFGLAPDEITQVLDNYKALGVETIFVIRGDQPQDPNFKPHPESFAHASDIIAFIKKDYDFCLGCAGYPEGHIQAESLEKDIDYLKLKQDNGAEYAVTQYCYDNDVFFKYVEKCQAAGITIPIIPGIMPVYTVKMTNMLSKVCGTTITDDMKRGLDQLDPEDKDAVLDFGVDFAVEQCRGLIKNGFSTLHFYTMDRSRSTTAIVNRLREEKLL
ncbi:methylenetetrahydrofolate reductase [Desulfosarcina variabilis]|uniref:methylenetetrahydrofolate reductase n=1 Tax=Desulfosarcina variabilis TaxID=2300 RepID=UPI003AFA8805